ncbi:hypothetical protein TIFTF001_021757 [Ficus carica]|uniref:Uncharacterized protein n=1 Tax=Ficus carica TaxID=3494 RepID=A0AA88DJV3_FICCA|nr:hypothetical protein TIFTF001_021757 [Ficus carica]
MIISISSPPATVVSCNLLRHKQPSSPTPVIVASSRQEEAIASESCDYNGDLWRSD